MTSTWDNILHVTDVISLLIFFPGCMFILIVNILDWRKNKRLEITDQIISGLGIFVLFHRIYQISFRCFTLTYGLNVTNSFVKLSFNFTYLSLISCVSLFSAWLAIHFCLKIVNINQNLYIYIQHTFPQMFPWILLLSVLASLLISGPAAQDLQRELLNSTNVSYSPLKTFISLKLYFVFTSLCFLIFVISLLLAVVSLYRHIYRMQHNAINFRAETAEAHVTAVKTLISLLVLNILYFVLVVFAVHDYGQLLKEEIHFFTFTICHAVFLLTLICGNRKLLNKLHGIWLGCSSRLLSSTYSD
ncbi:hypothetical protein GDO78_020032 [Eleutherodactylus coqui]|uniref:Taste receptor type 2 n=1 Tax=Eleutherodactylus coqui TaxID=57060 RepID=A0A8J6ECE9_ELECQ|nr:hypothetical protein GDO78_020032 [Eleutherodactylus coqui]